MSFTSATQALLDWPSRALRTDLGRRSAAAVLVSIALATTVQTLYANADVPAPAGAARGAVAGPAGAPGKAAAAAGEAAGGDGRTAGRQGGGAKPDQPKPPEPAKPADVAAKAAGDPGKVAVAWYAAKRGVPAGKVTLLQQRRISGSEVRVLVMAQVGERVDTAEVKVRRTRTGWKVP